MATVETAPQGADPRGSVTPRPLVIVGGGEHARVVADAARSRPDLWQLTGFTDPAGNAAGAGMGLVHLGDDAAFVTDLAATPVIARPALVLGFGAPLAARRRAAVAFGSEADWATVVHGSAWVSPSAVIEPGAVVLAGAIVNAGARVGAHAIVNSGAVVEHDVIVGPGAHLGPGVVVGGGARIGDESMIGLGAAVRDHISIGRRTVVGMGAVVVADVADDTTVVGVPARARGTPDG
jgi:acetyltransferase EpsM